MTDRTQPVLLTTLPLTGNSNDVKVESNRAYLAGDSAGVHVVDVTDPQNPQLLRTIDTPGRAIDLVLADELLYVADGASGLVIINMLDINTAAIIGELFPGGFANGIDISGSMVVMSRASSSAQIIDVSQPTTPQLLGALDVGPLTFDVQFEPPFAYLASDDGLRLIDFSDPAQPVFVGMFAPGLTMTDLLRVDQELIFTTQVRPDTPMPIFDVSMPDAPNFAGDIIFSTLTGNAGDGTGLAADNQFAYMTASRGFEVDSKPVFSGLSRFYTGQYRALDDTAGNPPVVNLTSPAPGLTVTEGDIIRLAADASDDVAVTAVNFLVDGSVVFTDTSAPYRFNFTVPAGVTSVVVSATGADAGNNVGAAQDVTVNVLPDVQPPSVSITSPLPGANVIENTPVLIQVAATDNVPVTSVEFLVDGVVAFTDIAGPFEFELTAPAPVASLTLGARSIDVAGNVGVATDVVVTVVADMPPSVSITSPVAGAEFSQGENVFVTVVATDDIGVTSVDFLVDGVVTSTDTFPPYQFTTTVPLGASSLTLGAMATDTVGNISTAQDVVLTIVGDAAPAVSITSPTPGATFSEGDSILFSATATDDIGVASVDFLADGAVVFTDTFAPFQFNFTIPLGNPSVTLGATATDTGGNVGTAADVVINVLVDPPPSIVITFPPDGVPLVEGETAPISADASDNGLVASVVFRIDGVDQPADTMAPFSVPFVVPVGAATVMIEATATDNVGKTATVSRIANVVVNDPQTTVVGQIVDPLGAVAPGVTATCLGVSGLTGVDGSFSIANVSTIDGPIRCTALFTAPMGQTLVGESAEVAFVRGGTTDVGLFPIGALSLYPNRRLFAGNMPNTVLEADVNNDGFPDLVVLNTISGLPPEDVSVLLGKGDGSFEDERRFPLGDGAELSMIDMDSDGVLDLVALNGNDEDISILLGNGNGTFQPQQRFDVGRFPTDFAAADLNGDSAPDLVTINDFANDVSVLLGNGDGTLQPEDRLTGLTGSPTDLAIADFDGDAIPDIVTTNVGSNEISLHRQWRWDVYDASTLLHGQWAEGHIGGRF